ncbi:hypothetical protein GCM10020218_060180 [Dactylosporangium vinaceum]
MAGTLREYVSRLISVSRSPAIGAARASRATAAATSVTTGRRSPIGTRPGLRRCRAGLTRRRPSRTSRAGRTLSEPATATSVTRIVAVAREAKMTSEARYRVAPQTATASPDPATARPDVAAASSTRARASSGPPARARSSRSRLT